MINSIIKVTISIIILLGIFNSATATGQTLAQESPPVLAFYYAWFDQNTWTSGQSVDLPLERYASADRAAIERHVRQAQSAGIDAFVQSWYGPQEANNQTETNFRALLEIGGATGFQAAVDFEVTGPFFGDVAAVTNALATLLATHAQHPAYLRYQGKPVIFFWQQQRFPIETWQTIRNQVDPDRTSFWIAEGVDIDYQAVFEGHHLYSIAWAGSPEDELAKWGNRVRGYETDHQVERLWAATVMPGYDDTRLPRDNAFAVLRRGGDYYRETWQGAVASQPDMIIITSFNEWPEGTHIEPSVAYGNLYLDITRELVTKLRGAPPPVPILEAAAVPSEEPSTGEEDPTKQSSQTEIDLSSQPLKAQAAQPQPPDGPFIQVESITNVRSGPSTDFERVGRLGAGESAPVIGQVEGGSWWLIEFAPIEAGQGWVSAEVVEFRGDSSQVPVVEAPSLSETSDPAIERPTIEIPAGGLNVRSGPGLDFEVLGRLDEGQTTTVVGKSEAGDWWQVEFAAAVDGVGWITAALVDFSDDPATVPVVIVRREDDIFPTPIPTPTAPVTVGNVEATDAVNVRSEPALDAPRLGGLFLGETAEVLAISEDGQWWQIDFGGDLGWISVEFVRFLGDPNAVPIFGAGTVTPTPGPTDTPTATPVATATPTPEAIELPATFAPTATSVYDATAAAVVAERGTPDPSLNEAAAEDSSSFEWRNLPWGVLAIVLVAGFLWIQFSRRRRFR